MAPGSISLWVIDRNFHRSWPGRHRVDAEIRQLIRTMAQVGWGAPRIYAKLTKLEIRIPPGNRVGVDDE